MSEYAIKWSQELVWALLLAVVGGLYAFLTDTDLSTVTANPAAALAALGVVLYRIIGATVWNFFKAKFSE